MIRYLTVFLLIQIGFTGYGQYHPIPSNDELNELKKVSDKAYKKSGLKPYTKSIMIFYGDLGCDDVLGEKLVNKSLFEQGIKFGYYTRKKCLFKKEKYLAANIYYLDEDNELLGYFDGQSVFPAVADNGDKMYAETERFIQYIIENEFTDIFNLGCALDISKYYALDKDGDAVLLDEFLFREGKNPVLKIDELK